MPARPWTDADDAELRRLHAAGRSLHSIAKDMGRSKGTISEKADRAGLTWEKTRTEEATRSRKAVCAELRSQLEEQYLRVAKDSLDQLEQPMTVYSFGGKDHTYEERTLKLPDPQGRLKLVQASGAALDRALRIDQHASASSADGVRSMLGRLGAALGLAPADSPPEPEAGSE